jgi:hypothetical protein
MSSRRSERLRDSAAAIFWIGFAARLLWILVAHTYRFRANDANFSFGWETGRIARSIATGEGFSSPFVNGTGPTAWVAPLYPYLLAAVFKLFGVYTQASALAILVLNSAFSALTGVVVFHIGLRSFGPAVARWAAWIWALLPYAMYWAVRWPWETSLAALLLACAFLQALRMAGIGEPQSVAASLRGWLLFGLLWAVIALVNPSLLLWLPFCGVWLLAHDLRAAPMAKGTAWRNAIFAGLVFLLLMAPWTARNYLVFHKFIPMRGNFGVEFHLGNSESADGLWNYNAHPSRNQQELELYRQVGEVNYAKMKMAEARQFVASHPAGFLELCARRFFYFWFNTPQTSNAGGLLYYRHIAFGFTSIVAWAGAWLAWKRRAPAGLLYASLLLAVPFVYYLTFPHPRYRAPIEPQITVLGVYLFQSAKKRNPLEAAP